jgi:hypothetical protein
VHPGDAGGAPERRYRDSMQHDPVDALKREWADAIVALAHPMPMIIAARRLGIDVARMCDLRKGRYRRFSLDRLVRILSTVDRTVTLTVTPRNPLAKINWFPGLMERRLNHPMTKQRMAAAEEARKRRREAERDYWLEGNVLPTDV